MVKNKKVLRIVLFVTVMAAGLAYLSIVQYSYTLWEGTWAGHISDGVLTKVEDKPGFYLKMPGVQIINIPKRMLSADSGYLRLPEPYSDWHVRFAVFWKVTDPELFFNHFNKIDSDLNAAVQKNLEEYIRSGLDTIDKDVLITRNIITEKISGAHSFREYGYEILQVRMTGLYTSGVTADQMKDTAIESIQSSQVQRTSELALAASNLERLLNQDVQ